MTDIFKEEIETLNKICNLLQEWIEKSEKNQQMLDKLFQELNLTNAPTHSIILPDKREEERMKNEKKNNGKMDC